MDKIELNPQVILSFDPGGSTGWASWSYEKTNQPFDMGQLGPEDHHLELWRLLCSYYTAYSGEMIIITESFEFRNSNSEDGNRDGLNLMAREYIGIMRLFAAEYDVPIFQQMPSKAKGFVKNVKLQQLGLLPEKNVHEQRHSLDALRHLIFGMVNIPELKHLKRKEILNAWKNHA